MIIVAGGSKRTGMISDTDPSITFLYLGRRGALGQFTRELIDAARRVPEYRFDVIVSSDGATTGDLSMSEDDLLAVPTFSRSRPLNAVGDYFRSRRRILDRLRDRRPKAVVTLMPHVWTPLLAPAIKALGIKYLPIIHDARPHPGDKTAWVTRWLRRDARHGDRVVTLSQAVAACLVEDRIADPSQILSLFHPDLAFQSAQRIRQHDPARPLRLLFFGRVMGYKGLSHLLDAVQILRDGGVPLELGLAGSGELGEARATLKALDAEIINRWIDESEVTEILDRYDALACPHIEASQSGVAAAAFGHRMPVVAMPVGGVAEQVIDGKTGVVARQVTARAFADAVKRLALEPGLYDTLSTHLDRHGHDRSMDRFLREILNEIGP